MDLERDACPLRIDYYEGDRVTTRVEIARLVRRTLSGGRAIHIPVAGRALSFAVQVDKGAVVLGKEPVYEYTYTVLPETVRF